MSNYTPTTLFGPKDSLPPTNPAKTIFGAAYDVEFANIATAIASKLDASGGVVTSIAGTANQIVASASTGAVTLSLPSSVTIAGTLAAAAVTIGGVAVSTAIGANPSASIGLSVVNGSSANFLRSDSAPSLSQSIVPTWTGIHTFSAGLNATSVSVFAGAAAQALQLDSTNSGGSYQVFSRSSSVFAFVGNSGVLGGSALDFLGIRGQTGIDFITNGGAHIAATIATSGNLVVNAPSSGVALTATAIAGGNATIFNQNGPAGTSAVFNSVGAVTTAGGGSVSFDTNGNMFLQTGTANTGLTIGSFVSGTTVAIVTAGASRVAIGSGGNVIISPAASGNSLATTGNASGGYAAAFTGSTTSGQSNGVQIVAGTTTGDLAFQILNSAVTQNLLRVDGTGTVIVGGPTAAAVVGLGALNAVTMAINGNPIYAGVPVNNQAGSYTAVLADANKQIVKTGAGAATITIPANSSVAFPIGTLITIHCSVGTAALSVTVTTDTLIWAQTGSLTSTRALAAAGLCTLTKINATSWVIAGTGVS